MIRVYTEDLINDKETVAQMFAIIRDNMARLLGEEAIHDGDKEVWIKHAVEDFSRIEKGMTIVLFQKKRVIGYLQLMKDEKRDEDVMIREIEIDRNHQGDHCSFRALITSFLALPQVQSCRGISGYINPRNEKSKEVFTALTMQTKDGRYYRANKNKFEETFADRLK